MDVRELDINYLNRFLSDLWPGISDILQAEVTHRAFEEAGKQPGRMSRRRTSIDLSAFPEITRNGDNGLKLRIPGTGSIRFSTCIYLLPWFPVPRILADVDISVETAISPGAEPETTFETAVRSNLFGSVIDRLVEWKDTIRTSFSGDDLAREFGYFGAVRYDPSVVAEIPAPELIYPERQLLDAGVNIFLVPESFSPEGVSRFDEFANAAVRRLSLPDDSFANEPFFSFKTALRIWTIKPDQSVDGDHVMGSFRDPRGHRRAALGNLARLAAIGRAAEAAASGLTLLVFVVNPEAPRFGGRRPSAMALGSVVLQPLQETPEQDASVLLHELGHTVLAGLGDEYVLSSRHDDRYLGRPVGPANLTSDPELRKWRRWLDSPSILPDWDTEPIVGAEGAGYFGGGLWRPAERCAMRASREKVAFCAVCREALTNGIRRVFVADSLLLRVESPSGEQRDLTVNAGEHGAAKHQVPVDEGGAATLKISLLAATLPEPWEISTRFTGRRVVETIDSASETPTTIGVNPEAGDRLFLTVESRCPFTPWDPIPSIEVEIEFTGREAA